MIGSAQQGSLVTIPMPKTADEHGLIRPFRTQLWGEWRGV